MNQMMLSIGAVTLLGTLFIPARKLSLNREQVLISSEATSSATAIGQELIEEITVRKFDEKFSGRGESTNVATNFSAILRPDAGEDTSKNNPYITTFDDVDDFNGYRNTVSTSRLGNFNDTVKVYYVNEDTPDVVSSTQTFLKRIDVKVRNPYVFSKDSTITISKVISYRYRGGP